MEELEKYRRRVRELEQTLAERELRQAADTQELSRLALAFQSAKIRAWCWTAENRLTHYLPAAVDVYDSQGRNTNQASLTEQKILAAIHPDDRKRVASKWNQAHEEHMPYEIEYRLIPAGDEVRHNYEIATPEFDKSGRYLGHFGTSQDITEVRQVEDALRESEAKFKHAARSARLGHWSFDVKAGRYLGVSADMLIRLSSGPTISCV